MTSNPIDETLAILEQTLVAASMVAERVAADRAEISPLMPVSPDTIAALQRRNRADIDAFMFGFISLAGMLQDRLTRTILLLLEQDLSRASRLDMRMMLEKLGALAPERDFGAIGRLRNRLVHEYPHQPERQVRIINEAYTRSLDLLAGYADMTSYANERFFGGRLSPFFPSS